MKAINYFLSMVRSFLPWAQEAADRNDFCLKRDDNGEVSFDSNPDDEILAEIFSHGQLQVMQTYILLEIIKEGPKILNLPDNYVAPLLNTDLNLTISDYNQPFRLMCVNLPAQFIEKYVSEYDDDAYGNGPGQHSPSCVIVCHDDASKTIIVHVIFTSYQAITAMFTKAYNIEQQIEESLLNKLDGSVNIDQTEIKAAVAAIKIALNAMLLADNYLKPLGPYNKAYYDRLNLLKNKKNITPAQMRSTTAELTTHPFIFEINQNVETHSSATIDPTGITSDQRGNNKPHWRKGHYRMQRYGKDLVEMKRVRIPPVLVNAHLFIGNHINNKIVYDLNTPIPENK